MNEIFLPTPPLLPPPCPSPPTPLVVPSPPARFPSTVTPCPSPLSCPSLHAPPLFSCLSYSAPPLLTLPSPSYPSPPAPPFIPVDNPPGKGEGPAEAMLVRGEAGRLHSECSQQREADKVSAQEQCCSLKVCLLTLLCFIHCDGLTE